jgi:hypothetical protein
MESTTPTDDFSNAYFIRQRWAAMGLDRSEADVQAAAKAMDEEEARCLKQQAQSESPDEDIDDAWQQDREDRETKQQPEDCRDTRGGLDDIFQSIKNEYREVSKPTGQPDPIPEPEHSQTAAEAVAEAVSRSSDRSGGLTEECPLYIINRALANCRVLTSTERCCIGLLNSLMQKHGHAFVSNEQLALWLCMKSPDTVRNMLARLTKMGFIANTGRRHLEIRWVVCQDMQNPKRKSR